MIKLKKSLYFPALAILGGILISISFIFGENWTAIVSKIGSGVIMAVFTVYAINRFIQKGEEYRWLNVKQLIYRELLNISELLLSHLEWNYKLYHVGVAISKGEDDWDAYSSISSDKTVGYDITHYERKNLNSIADKLYKELLSFDLSGKSKECIDSFMRQPLKQNLDDCFSGQQRKRNLLSFFKSTEEKIAQCVESFDKILTKYGTFLEPSILETILTFQQLRTLRPFEQACILSGGVEGHLEKEEVALIMLILDWPEGKQFNYVKILIYGVWMSLATLCCQIREKKL